MLSEWYNTLSLEELNEEQWEALCDGCGKCCMLKIDNKKKTLDVSNIACPLLNVKTKQCKDYTNRLDKISYCLDLTPETVRENKWLPDTCAYRLRAEDKPLFNWHYLVSGKRGLTPKIKGDIVNLTMNDLKFIDKRLD
tara:strand:- start:6 stop:419 length:414 start_codon:yes stop_codon:yes gene_type:complete